MSHTRLYVVALAGALVVGGTVVAPEAGATVAAQGSIALNGTMTFSPAMTGELPDVPSPNPLGMVGSGETFPVSGNNETCGKNNGDGGIGSTYVPDPLVDEVGICEGALDGLPPEPFGSYGTWGISLGSEPPDVCRGLVSHDASLSAHVCTIEGYGLWEGTCEVHRGSGHLFVTFESLIGPSIEVKLAIGWTIAPATAGVAVVNVSLLAVDGVQHSGPGMGAGQLTFQPSTCTDGSTSDLTVTGDLHWAEAA